MSLEGFRERKTPMILSKRFFNTRLPYDKLPTPIQGRYSEKEYLWLSDREKANLIETECLPEYEED